MAEFVASGSQWLDTLLNHLGIHAFKGAEGALCILGLALLLVFCANAYSAIRVAFLRSYSRR
jgi:hypothetical protein